MRGTKCSAVTELVPNVPEDFDAFWSEALAEADAVGLDFARRKSVEQPLSGHEVELIEFRAASKILRGWIAIPHNRERRTPAFLWLPPYGRESTLPNEYSTREGMISMSFNFHGHDAFHQEEYQPSRGYLAQGIESPETWVFREMAQDCFIAMRVLQAQIEADENRLAIAGLSQGGGMAIWTAAHSKIPACVVADLPFLSGMHETLAKPVYRYPLKEVLDFADTIPLGMQRVMHTVSYFDTLNHATRVKAPTLVSLGQKDPAVRPANVRAVYDAIPVKKRLIEYETGHDWNTAMVETNRNWLLQNM
jgi:cephalosporin-C deacetylase